VGHDGEEEDDHIDSPFDSWQLGHTDMGDNPHSLLICKVTKSTTSGPYHDVVVVALAWSTVRWSKPQFKRLTCA